MSFIQKIRKVINSRNAQFLNKYSCTFRGISTSQKGSDDNTVVVESEAKKLVPKKKIRNWQTYGFDPVDQKQDLFLLHATSFCWIFMVLWGSIFVFSYYPDMEELDWAAREARIELRRREVLGLPLVDKNYVDPATIRLPPEEELGDNDIII